MAPSQGADERLNLTKLTCLAVDANPAALRIVDGLLNSLGVGRLITCGTVAEAQKVVQQRPLDLIMIEARMPGMDGYGFTKWLRGLEFLENRLTPVLIVTGETRLTYLARGRDMGANLVMAKPLQPKALIERLFSIARDERDFIESEGYSGPDRRFRDSGPPDGVPGRRHDELRVPGKAVVTGVAS
jgi:CheY-like chemotaxis protein